jgi:hypothetical protein
MLTELVIRDLALIEAAEVELAPGLNALTGETGAGKSLLIDALGLAIGARADTTLVRHGADVARVEALFDRTPEPLIATREVSASGRSTARLDDETVTAARLADTVGPLVEIHGQHEQGRLLDERWQRELLDAFGGHGDLRAAVARTVERWSENRVGLAAAAVDPREVERRLELLRHEVEEIGSAKLRAGEAAELRERLDLARHGEAITRGAAAIRNALDGEGSGARDIVGRATSEARSLARVDPRFEAVAGRLAGLEAELEDAASEVRALAEEYRYAADWLNEMAAREPVDDHVDQFFVEQVLGGLEHDLRVTGEAIALAGDAGEFPDPDRMTELHRRLAWTFGADVTTFERKRYSSLSHEANKAMNLNAYIGLIGGAYREEQTPDGVVLRPVAESHPDRVQPGDLVIPDAGYLLTLDADSLLLREYCLRLVHLLEQPENSRVAVTQTPYSAFRGAGTRIERLAGATTDLQHMLHQGSTRYDGTFWVGANAVIRKSALDDIVETEQRGGFEVRRYVQDRTVIEDTESSIDLAAHGWTLVNYPERLSYSATPPDFGSLVVQRRRWANGGLLILPKLWRQIAARRRARQPIRLLEVLLRINYMASIAWASIGLLFLLAFPYDSRLLSPFVLLAALPYFLAMQGDLHSMGYKRSDIFRIYGFNLILLPVQLAGVLKSMGQAISGKKIPFARTPKVRNRTAAPALFVIAPYLIIAFSVLTMVRDLLQQNWGNATFAAVNAVLASLAVVSYIGLWHSVVDIVVSARSWLFVERRPRAAARRPSVEVLDWRGVLYRGVDAGSGA